MLHPMGVDCSPLIHIMLRSGRQLQEPFGLAAQGLLVPGPYPGQSLAKPWWTSQVVAQNPHSSSVCANTLAHKEEH